MRSWRFLLTRRWVLLALVVVLLCYAAWSLGQWQFHRLEDRKQSNAVVRANEDREPAPVADVLSPGARVSADDEWRQVTATGEYDADETVLVRYRTRDGASGVDVVVPLVTADGTALLVDRGWLRTANQGTTVADVPAPPTGEVTVEGWVRADATGEGIDVSDHSTRALSSVTVGPEIGHPVYGGSIELRSEDGEPAAGLEPVELPELNNGPHFFYGLQWWFFGLLAVVGFGYLAWDERRSGRRSEAGGKAEDEASAASTGSGLRARRAERNARKQAVRAAYQRAYEKERAEREQAQRARSRPPSTGSITPDTNDEAGESTNAATRPNSSGSP